MSQSLPLRRLSVEPLEDRLTPAWFTPWFDGESLTISFVPDGTDISGQASTLFSTLGSTTAQSHWQRELLRGYQTWVVEANLNVGLVGDGGQAMGVVGAPQADIRFGDIRVGARPLSAPGTPNSTMANTAGFDYSSKTWAGDFVFNSLYRFGIGDSPGDHVDLFSVALHEASHSFGLPDQNTDPTSAQFNTYQGVLTGLSARDIADLQALYGARQDDQFEGSGGNGTIGAAFDLGTLRAVSADITRIGDADVYKFTTPSDATGLTIDLQTAGISLLTARVTVLDASGTTVASGITTDPLDNNLSISLAGYQASSTYFVKVEGAGSDVFSVGSYVLRLNYEGGNATGSNTSIPSEHVSNFESATDNDTFAQAVTLTAVQQTKANSFVLSGEIASASDVDWYKITPTLATQFTGTLFVGTMTTTNGLLPSVSVYDAQGQLLPTVVTMNEDGAFEIQLPNATTGQTYFIRVSAAASAGSANTGSYTLGATLAPVNPISFTQVVANALSTSESVQYTQMEVAGDRLTQFALSATGGSTTSATAVRMSVFDATGHLVFTTVALAGDPLATGAVWLSSGFYTVVFNAATSDGSALGSLGMVLSARTLTDPIDPYPVDPLLPPPPPLVPITVPLPTPTPPPQPIVDPITNPFAGMTGVYPPIPVPPPPPPTEPQP